MLRKISNASGNVLHKAILHHRFLSTVPKVGKVLIQEGSVSVEVDAAVASNYVKDQTFDQDLSIEIFNIFAKVIEAERQTRHETKVLKYKADGLDAPTVPLKGISIMDAVFTDGVRALRYMKETTSLRHIFVNNRHHDENAKKDFAKNLERNGISADLATFSTNSSEQFMCQFLDLEDGVDVVDLQANSDHFHLVDMAVQAVALDGGLLCVTSTNIVSLIANGSESLFRFYGSQPIKTKFPQEHAIRVLLHGIDAAANRYKRSIEPWLSLCHNGNVRVYVRVFKSAAGAKQAMQNRAMLYCNTHCFSFFYNRLINKNCLENAFWIENADAKTEGSTSKLLSTQEAKPKASLFGQENSPGDVSIDALFCSEDNASDANIDALFDTAPKPPSKQTKQTKKHMNISQLDAAPTGQSSRRAPTVMDLPELTGVPAHKWQTGGPVWAGPLHDQVVVDKLLGKFKLYDYSRATRNGNGASRVPTRKPSTTKEQITVLTAVSDELKDVLFAYDLNMMCKVLQCSAPMLLEVMSALQNAGYRVSSFHANHFLIKTDAPSHIMWDIMKDHASRNNYPKSLNPESRHIHDRPVTLKNVDYHLTMDIKKRFRTALKK